MLVTLFKFLIPLLIPISNLIIPLWVLTFYGSVPVKN